MYLNRILKNWARLGLLAITMTLSSTLPAHARDQGPQQAPPSFPDQAHVCNGCHLSTMRYLAHFLAQYPDERGEPLVINMRNADRTMRMHTMALVSWRGQAWCRDEYFGVFALGIAFGSEADSDRLAARVERLYHSHSQDVIRSAGMPRRPDSPDEMSSDDRLQQVTLATQIIPYHSTIYWLKSGREEFPVAFFRPSARQIGVYDPINGTSLAECSIRDDAKVVSLVAGRLGYRPDHVRRDLNLSRGALLADAGTSK